MTNTVTKLITATAFAGLLTAGAQAVDTPSTMPEWQSDASKAISETMYYPRVAANLGKTGNGSYNVTINRDGEVTSIDGNETTGNKSLDAASWRTIEKADFPALPASFAKDELTFQVSLSYKESMNPTREAYLNRNQGNVVGGRIAILDVE